MHNVLRYTMMACVIHFSSLAEVTLTDTVGPDVFWFRHAEFLVSNDSTMATLIVDFSPGNRGWYGSVSYRTHDGTAIGGIDYTPVSGKLSISGPRPGFIHVPIHGSPGQAQEKWFTVELFGPSGYPEGQIYDPGTAVVRMRDNTNGVISFALARQHVFRTENLAHIRVIRTGPTSEPLQVGYRTGYWYELSSAYPDRDYRSTSGTLLFGPGETEKSFTVEVLNATSYQSPVTAILTLSEDYGPDFHLGTKKMELVIVSPPRLTIRESNSDNLEISWPDDGVQYVLLRSDDVAFEESEIVPFATTGNYCTALEAKSSAARFYRLRTRDQ